MGSADKFCLKWNDFETNISQSFKDLREQEQFLDVTLLCDGNNDDASFEAHRVVLSACSPFFRHALARQAEVIGPRASHSTMYLHGIRPTHLQHCLDFMYYGEVNVAQDDLNDFLAVAEDLQVKGLAQNSAPPLKGEPAASGGVKRPASDTDRGGGGRVTPTTAPRQKKAKSTPKAAPAAAPAAAGAGGSSQNDSIQHATPVKLEGLAAGADVVAEEASLETAEFGDDAYADYEAGFEGAEGDLNPYTTATDEGGTAAGTSAMQDVKGDLLSYEDYCKTKISNAVDGSKVCLLCGVTIKHVGNVKRHYREKHQAHLFTYCCPSCGVLLKTKRCLVRHIGQFHPQLKGLDASKCAVGKF